MTSSAPGAAPTASYCSNCGMAASGNFCAGCGSRLAGGGLGGGAPASPPYGSSATAGVSLSGLNGTSGMAIAALVAAFFVPPAGFVLALIAKAQIRRTGESGDGLATAALVISLVSMIIFVVMIASIVHTQHQVFHNFNGPAPGVP